MSVGGFEQAASLLVSRALECLVGFHISLALWQAVGLLVFVAHGQVANFRVHGSLEQVASLTHSILV